MELFEDLSNESKGKKLIKNHSENASFLHCLQSDYILGLLYIASEHIFASYS